MPKGHLPNTVAHPLCSETAGYFIPPETAVRVHFDLDDEDLAAKIINAQMQYELFHAASGITANVSLILQFREGTVNFQFHHQSENEARQAQRASEADAEWQIKTFDPEPISLTKNRPRDAIRFMPPMQWMTDGAKLSWDPDAKPPGARIQYSVLTADATGVTANVALTMGWKNGIVILERDGLCWENCRGWNWLKWFDDITRVPKNSDHLSVRAYPASSQEIPSAFFRRISLTPDGPDKYGRSFSAVQVDWKNFSGFAPPGHTCLSPPELCFSPDGTMWITYKQSCKDGDRYETAHVWLKMVFAGEGQAIFERYDYHNPPSEEAMAGRCPSWILPAWLYED